MSTKDTTLYLRNELPLEACPHCGVRKPRIWIISRSETHDYAGARARAWGFYSCSTCGGVVVAASPQGTGDRITEIFPSIREFDESIPERARRHLREASNSIHSPGVSIVGSAAAIDAMLKARNYKTGSLYSRIDQAAADHLITADMARWAHNVRLDANDERHADENAPFPETEDAQRCLDFAMALAEILFMLPARVTRGIQAAGSPPAPSSTSPSS